MLSADAGDALSGLHDARARSAACGHPRAAAPGRRRDHRGRGLADGRRGPGRGRRGRRSGRALRVRLPGPRQRLAPRARDLRVDPADGLRRGAERRAARRPPGAARGRRRRAVLDPAALVVPRSPPLARRAPVGTGLPEPPGAQRRHARLLRSAAHLQRARAARPLSRGAALPPGLRGHDTGVARAQDRRVRGLAPRTDGARRRAAERALLPPGAVREQPRGARSAGGPRAHRPRRRRPAGRRPARRPPGGPARRGGGRLGEPRLRPGRLPRRAHGARARPVVSPR